MADPEVVELTFPAERSYLSLVRTTISSLAGHIRNFDETRVEDLRLAVSEACANAIDAYTAREQADDVARVVVVFRVRTDRLEAEVCDHAGGFDPQASPTQRGATKGGRSERGLGIPLMRAAADELEIRPDGDGTTVRLVVRAGRRAHVRYARRPD